MCGVGAHTVETYISAARRLPCSIGARVPAKVVLIGKVTQAIVSTAPAFRATHHPVTIATRDIIRFSGVAIWIIACPVSHGLL